MSKLIRVWWLTCKECGCFDCLKQREQPTHCRKCKSNNIELDMDCEEMGEYE